MVNEALSRNVAMFLCFFLTRPRPSEVRTFSWQPYVHVLRKCVPSLHALRLHTIAIHIISHQPSGRQAV